MYKELQKGDSGSWVIDAENLVLGYVVAISPGTAYLIPFADVLKEVDDVLKSKAPASPPSPFKMLANLARHYRWTNLHGNMAAAESFASRALAPETLNCAASDPSSKASILLVRAALRHGEEKDLLMRLLLRTGEDLSHAIRNKAVWTSFESRHGNTLDEALTELLTRLEDYAAEPLEIDVFLRQTRIADPEKGNTTQGTNAL